jgi:hypothetical protein
MTTLMQVLDFIHRVPQTRRCLTVYRVVLFIVLGVTSAAFSQALTFNNNLTKVFVDGSTVAFGSSVSVIFDSGVFHMWYRNVLTGDISDLQHATSTDGIHFTTTGTISFTNNPFAGGTAPFLYYENVAKVGANYKIFHWTPNGGAGTFPVYDYNISVSNIGPNPNTLAVFHQGPMTGGLGGQTAGSFGFVAPAVYCQGGPLGQSLCRATPYVDTNPPSTPPPGVTDFSALFTSLGIPTGYINNHSDVIQLGPTTADLGFFFTLRDGAGNRFNKQVYLSSSSDGGLTWSAPLGLFTNPTVDGAVPFGNFAHADAVTALGTVYLYLSTELTPGNFVIAVTTSPVGVGDEYQIRYLANLDKGDSYVNFTNAGTLNGADPAGRICVNVYTFDPAEELISCCACPITPNGLNSLSARNDLISNTLTPGVPTSVTVKLLSTLPLPGNTCNPASPSATNLVRGLRAWATTLHLNTSGSPAVGYQQTETPFSRAELSFSELTKLTGFCAFIQANGSGFGICKSCRSGALGAGQK